jgi:redox-sensitive bicupin YhaK (pirin superfamily)
MSNTRLVIEERASRIGNFLVGRLLPFREKRMVGPFIFIDHMGPVSVGTDGPLSVPPHPHIGLSTLTYLFEGEIMHRDSLGNELLIRPGEVNWMTAGRGIVHSERTPAGSLAAPDILHGLQIWIALPAMHEHDDPSFVHLGADELPQWREGALRFRLIAGDFRGRRSPVPVFSPLYLVEVRAEEDAELDTGDMQFGEHALYILEGSVREGDNRYESRRILVAGDSGRCRIRLDAGAVVFLFGGEAFAETRHIDWNFVSSDPAVIAAAREKWKRMEFDPVPGETEFVPYPGTR